MWQTVRNLFKFDLPRPKVEYGLVGLMILISAILCLWNISEGAQFLGDQGRDALTVAKIFKEGDLVFIGPVMSVGNLYLGPLYYYFMLPFLWLSYPNPIGPVLGVLLLHLITIFCIYRWGKKMIGSPAALVAIVLYAVNITVIYHARFSWNPNITPFFSITLLYSLWQVWQGKRWYFVTVIAAFSVLMQVHYVTLLVLPTIGLVWLRWVWLEKKHIPKIIGPTLLALLVFLISLTPLILFDIKHDGQNVNAFIEMITKSNTFNDKQAAAVEGSKLFRSIKEMQGRSFQLFFETSIGQIRSLNSLLLIGLVTFVGFQIWKKRATLITKEMGGVSIIIMYLFWGVVALSVYENSVYFHYILFLLPAVMLLFGWVGVQLWKYGFIGQLVAFSLAIFYLAFSFTHLPYTHNSWPMARYKLVAQDIAQQVPLDRKYDLVSVSESSGDLVGLSYRYFLYTLGHEPVAKEELGTIDTLVIIIEEQNVDIDDVFNSGIYEIETFPKKEPYKILETGDGIRVLFMDRALDAPS